MTESGSPFSSQSQKAVTIREVAKRAGVSVATVSRVLNGSTSVDPLLAERVQAAVAHMHYQPSRAARMLAGSGSALIGLLVTDMQNPFFLDVIRGVEEIAQQQGYLLVVCNTLEDAGKEERYLQALVAEPVAGAIVIPTQAQQPGLELFKARGIPLVIADRHIDDRSIDTVLIDNIGAAREVIVHLINNGYRRIGVVSGPSSVTNSSERIQGYRQALQEREIKFDEALIQHGSLTSEDDGFELTNRLLDLSDPIDAIFATNNRLTVGALKALYERKKRIPEDVALVGFDASYGAFPDLLSITTIAQSAYDLGCTAANRLLHLLKKPGVPKQEIILQYSFLIHQSSQPRGLHSGDERKTKKNMRTQK